jgi:hypothetical protein
MKKTQLRLNREAVRVLTPPELGHVNGGVYSDGYSCPSECINTKEPRPKPIPISDLWTVCD